MSGFLKFMVSSSTIPMCLFLAADTLHLALTTGSVLNERTKGPISQWLSHFKVFAVLPNPISIHASSLFFHKFSKSVLQVRGYFTRKDGVLVMGSEHFLITNLKERMKSSLEEVFLYPIKWSSFMSSAFNLPIPDASYNSFRVPGRMG